MIDTTTKRLMNWTIGILSAFLVLAMVSHYVMESIDDQQELNEQRDLPAWLN